MPSPLSLLRGGAVRSAPMPLSTRPSVTVVIPCYNYGHYLPDAVSSALGQRGVDVDVVIVDDASQDDSLVVARRLERDDDRVSVIAHAVNRGHIATYNDGLRSASGDYVVLLSADDLLTGGSLARSTAVMEHHPDVSLVYGYAPEFTDTPPVLTEHVRDWSIFTGESWIGLMCRRGSNIIVNPEAVLRRRVMVELGGYDPTLPQAADMMLWLRAATLGNVGRVNGSDQALYRVHGANMHINDFQGLLTEMNERKRVFESFFASEGDALPGADGMQRNARRAMAVEALRVASIEQDADLADKFVDFARECDPTLEDSRPMRTYRAREHRPAGGLTRAYARHIHDIRWSLRWRRWRRYGT